MIPPNKRFDIFCSEDLDAFRLFFKQQRIINAGGLSSLTGGCSEGLGAFTFFFLNLGSLSLLKICCRSTSDTTLIYILLELITGTAAGGAPQWR